MALAKSSSVSSGMSSVIEGAPGRHDSLCFAFGSPTGRDDADDVVEAFGADDHDEATADRSDADKAVLGIGMELVENLKRFDIICEELGSLLEGDAMILLVGKVLGVILFDPHGNSLSHWRSQSTT